jgi:beta-xylosidase
VGEDFYLATSSFEYFPGAPVFHSRNLVQWEQIGNILTRRSQFAAGDRRRSGGIFGSTLRHHDGLFWFVTTNMSDFGGGHLLFHAGNPAGPWSESVPIAGTPGIDPDIAWDNEGTCYLTWLGFGPDEGGSGVVQARLDPAKGRLLESPRKLWQGSGLAHPEGPHLYQRGGWWYLMIAEGGTERGHAVSISRSTSPSGPFEPHPDNPVFSHRSLDTPIQNVGHADLVEGPDGGWAAVHLGVRIRGSSPGYHVLGRETFLAGITWQDGWPRFEEDRFTVPAADTSFTDDFASGGALHPRWISPGNDPASFASHVPGAGLRLSGAGEDAAAERAPLLATRVRDEAWVACALVRPVDGAAELVLRIDDSHWYAVRVDGDTVRALARIGPLQQEIATAERRLGGAPLDLQIACAPAPLAGRPGKNFGPDEVSLGFLDAGGQLVELGRLDGRYLSTEVAGGFTGRVIGVSAGSGTAILERFVYSAKNP